LIGYIVVAYADRMIPDVWGRRLSLGHLGGAFAPNIVLWASAVAGFGGAFLAMAASGLATALLLPFAIRANGRSLEEATIGRSSPVVAA
jgi:hypothetical protein